MKISIEDGFKKFNSILIPRGEARGIEEHRSTIYEFLEKRFDVSRFFRVGSIDNDTDIHGHSRADYFAVIPPKMLLRDSDASLKKIEQLLKERFPQTKGIHISSPAVVIPFGINEKETTTIIPAEFLRKINDKCSLYEIPDRNGGWMIAAPDAHDDYMTLANLKRGHRVKPLFRFIKSWKYTHRVPIYSFYLEILTARYALNKEEINYQEDIEEIFKIILEDKLALIEDPLKLVGLIHPCHTNTDKEKILRIIEETVEDIKKANQFEKIDKINKSVHLWKKIMGEIFPSYKEILE